jgi:hypothetical protein
VRAVPRLKMWVLPWHLPYNWGKSTEKPQSGYKKNLSQVKKTSVVTKSTQRLRKTSVITKSTHTG